jgi:vancomycin permeability regulator SanA
MRKGRRRGFLVGAGILTLVVIGPIAWVQGVGQSHLRSHEDVPAVDAIVVLGAGLLPDQTPSLYLRRRLDAAAELFGAGVAPTIILSGDAHGPSYDEPAAMRKWILARGVPDEALVVDREGFNTTATCRRAHDVYAVRTAVVVTQDYHVRRAVFSCVAAGLDAVGVGVSAANASQPEGLWWHVRELPASWKAAFDALTHRSA